MHHPLADKLLLDKNRLQSIVDHHKDMLEDILPEQGSISLASINLQTERMTFSVSLPIEQSVLCTNILYRQTLLDQIHDDFAALVVQDLFDQSNEVAWAKIYWYYRLYEHVQTDLDLFDDHLYQKIQELLIEARTNMYAFPIAEYFGLSYDDHQMWMLDGHDITEEEREDFNAQIRYVYKTKACERVLSDYEYVLNRLGHPPLHYGRLVEQTTDPKYQSFYKQYHSFHLNHHLSAKIVFWSKAHLIALNTLVKELRMLLKTSEGDVTDTTTVYKKINEFLSLNAYGAYMANQRKFSAHLYFDINNN